MNVAKLYYYYNNNIRPLSVNKSIEILVPLKNLLLVEDFLSILGFHTHY